MKPFILVADGFDKKLFKDLCSVPGLEVHPESKVDKDGLEKLLPKLKPPLALKPLLPVL